VRSVKTCWFQLSIRYRGAIVIAIPAACLIATLGTWIWSRDKIRDAYTWVDHSETVITQSNHLLISLLNAETAIRGYGVTRDPNFLEPYHQARKDLPASLTQIYRLIEDNPQQQQKLQKVEGESQQVMHLLQSRLDDLRVEPRKTVSPQFQRFLYEGKKIMDQTRELVKDFQVEERRLLDERRQYLLRLRETTTLTLWANVGVGLLGYSAAMYLFSQLDRELRERELRLRESRTLIQAIVANVVDGVIALNEQGHIEIFNAAAVNMFGYEPTEVIGQDLSLLLAIPLRAENALEKQARFLDNHQIQLGRPWQMTAYRKNGQPFPIEISISDMQLNHGLIAIIRDVTERQQAEEKLQSRADELAQLSLVLSQTNTTLEIRNRELDQFAYVVSHDLKAPLRAIANLSEWLEEDLEDKLDEDTRSQMTLLRSRVHRLEALINGLLQYSRAGRVRVQPESVDVGTLLSEVIDSLSPPPEFTLEIQGKMPTLITEQLLLQQVFTNLISNAIKHHHRRDGKVIISAQARGNCCEFTVTDDGPGIAPEYHDKVFAIFQTLEARDKTENTGIGLSIVKKTVENQGGTIEIDSQVGQGTAFRFTWQKAKGKRQLIK
ncbi:MAG: CHASE3 domain-containing protein, partial [Microcystaceae cyanobacterium]